jgi:hypothetical protein
MNDLTSTATALGRDATAKARAFAESHPIVLQAKDAIYTAVGLGLRGTQQASAALRQTPRHVDTDAINASVRRGVADVTANLKKSADLLDERAGRAVRTLDKAVAPLEHLLPSALRDVTSAARTVSTKLGWIEAPASAASTATPTK